MLGAMNGCRDKGHNLVLQDLGERAPYKEPQETAQFLRDAGLDGVIVTPPLSNHDVFIDALKALGVMVVKIAPQNFSEGDLWVAMDDSQAVTDMVQHIVELGHSKIGFVKGPEDHPSAHQRYEGFKQAMKSNGLDLSLIHI